MKIYSPEQWFELAKNIHDLIIKETENISDLPTLYPKLVVMYEFFRLIRGEAFRATRPADIGEYQKELYKMEDEIGGNLKELENKLNPEDSKTKYQLEQMIKSFSLEYFN